MSGQNDNQIENPNLLQIDTNQRTGRRVLNLRMGWDQVVDGDQEQAYNQQWEHQIQDGRALDDESHRNERMQQAVDNLFSIQAPGSQIQRLLAAKPLRRESFMKLQRRQANAERIQWRKIHSTFNRITMGMRRKVISLRFGFVGSQKKLKATKGITKVIAATVGVKLRSIGRICYNYIRDGY